jgi:hypothetical protein
MQLQALDRFIPPPIPRFEGDSPIHVVPNSAQTPRAESACDSSIGPNSGSSRTQAGKRKASATLPTPKKPLEGHEQESVGCQDQ